MKPVRGTMNCAELCHYATMPLFCVPYPMHREHRELREVMGGEVKE